MVWQFRWGYITGRSAFEAPNLAPGSISLPVISGIPRVGQTLTTTNGTWTNSPTGFTYQWKRNGVNIGGATSNSYVVITADIGTTITATVTATNAGGSSFATSLGVGVFGNQAIISASRAGLSSVAVSAATIGKTFVIPNVGSVNG